jgi:hypothetical protein
LVAWRAPIVESEAPSIAPAPKHDISILLKHDIRILPLQIKV